jgi:hypothetical protein
MSADDTTHQETKQVKETSKLDLGMKRPMFNVQKIHVSRNPEQMIGTSNSEVQLSTLGCSRLFVQIKKVQQTNTR